jgi:hypothetical protein
MRRTGSVFRVGGSSDAKMRRLESAPRREHEASDPDSSVGPQKGELP